MAWDRKQQKLARMRRLPQEIRAEVSKAMHVSAEVTTEHIKSAAPEDDGHLKDSVTFADDSGPEKVAVKIIAGNTDAFYARMVEFGTYLQVAQPFFYPSIRTEKKRNKARLSRAARKGIKLHAARKSTGL